MRFPSVTRRRDRKLPLATAGGTSFHAPGCLSSATAARHSRARARRPCGSTLRSVRAHVRGGLPAPPYENQPHTRRSLLPHSLESSFNFRSAPRRTCAVPRARARARAATRKPSRPVLWSFPRSGGVPVLNETDEQKPKLQINSGSLSVSSTRIINHNRDAHSSA